MNPLQKPVGIQKVALYALAAFFLITPLVGYVVRKIWSEVWVKPVAYYWSWCGVAIIIGYFGYIFIVKYWKPHA